MDPSDQRPGKEFRINNFDVIRIFAAMQVMILHVLTYLKFEYPPWFQVIRPFSGVPMFFVISGFLISASYERNSDLKNYIRNRALRIYPGLWACVFITIVSIVLFTDISFIRLETLPWLLSQMAGLIFTPEFLKGYGVGAYHVSLWTIPIELQFYAVLPVLYLTIKYLSKGKRMMDIFFVTIFFLPLSTTYLYSTLRVYIPGVGLEERTGQKLLRYSFVPHIYLFLLGVILQRLGLYKSRMIQGKGLLWCMIFLTYVYLAPAYPNFWLFPANSIYSHFKTVIAEVLLGITTISLAYSSPGFAHNALKDRDISYGIYIYHGLVINIFITQGLTLNYFHVSLICVITIVLAYLSWIFVERPFIKKKKATLKESL